MLGKENKQTSFFDTGFVCAHLINKKSFYAKTHNFADIYCLNNGEPLCLQQDLPKFLSCKIMGIFLIEKLLKWKYALDVPIDYEGFDRSLLVYFRARLLANNKDKMVFKKILKLAKKAGL